MTTQQLATYPDPFDGDDRYGISQVDWSPDRKYGVSAGTYLISDPNSSEGAIYEGVMYVWELGGAEISSPIQ
ncbi:MAG TPA: hypothetical protein VFA09_19450 [Ktedonobacteraceae bacterium]|nr:hypothetical protein [Ktedonobacteraceae bacterium]